MSSQPRPDRRTFLAGAGASLAAIKLGQSGGGDEPRLTHGPFVSFLGERSLSAWARASAPGEYTIHAFGEKAKKEVSATASATLENDRTLHWRLDGLSREFMLSLEQPWITFNGKKIWVGGTAWSFPNPSGAGPLVIGSCADDHKFPTQLVWLRIQECNAGAIVLIGDTPYIDSTDLEVQRRRYREFFDQPEMSEALLAIPFYATWDDHDYAGNDLLGDVKGREQSRQAFLEYHPPGDYGENGQGIYSKFRRGTVEVFLLDTRWFADIETSPFDATKKSLLGAQQWKWLQEGLLASTATFKLLVCGMVWSGAVRGGKKDCWGNWPHEREGLLAWVGSKKVSGVVLVAGDVHRTRALRHPTKDIAGYDVVELITSPLANTVLESNKIDDPALLFDAGVEQSFLRLTHVHQQTGDSLKAEFVDGEGKTFYQLWLDSWTLRAS